LKLEDFVLENHKWMLAGQAINNFLVSNESSLEFFSKNPLKYFYAMIFLIIGGLRIISLYFNQESERDNDILKSIDHLVGTTQFGYKQNLDYRHKNYFKIFENEHKIKNFFLDEYDKKSFTKIFKFSFCDLVNELRFNVIESSNFISRVRSLRMLYLILPFCIKNIALFSYVSLLLRQIKSKNSHIKFFSGGNELFACAALKENISTHLLKHGSMSVASKSSFLQYSHVYVYSNDDLEYIKKISPRTNVSIYAFQPVVAKANNIIFFGASRDCDELDLLSEITNFFRHKGIKPFYKSHPVMDTDEQKLISQALDIELINEEIDGYNLIQKLNPIFCVGWASTALCESLNSAVIPICTQRENEKEILSEHAIVYPFEKRTLSWFKNRKDIEKLCSDRALYDRTILELQEKI